MAEEAPGATEEVEARPTLAAIWEKSLFDFLDADPFLLRPSDAGMGNDLDRLLGGGLSPGQTGAIVSLGAGIGKTALVHQLSDGIAEASAFSFARGLEAGVKPAVVPVLFVSEMTARDLTLRSLARIAGVEGYLLRDPRGPRGCRPLADGLTEGEAALSKARKAAKGFVDAAEFITVLDRHARVSVATIEDEAFRIRRAWERRGAGVPTVLITLDPIHRLLDHTRTEVDALGAVLSEIQGVAQRDGAIVLLTSDTTFAGAASRATVGARQKGADLARDMEAAFRSSYQLLHVPDIALGLLTLESDDENLSPEDAQRLQREPEGALYAEIVNAKSRWAKSGHRAAYILDPAFFRFRPTSSRELPGARSMEERIEEFVRANPGCSERQVRKGVEGRTDTIRDAVNALLRTGRIRDLGDMRTGKRLEWAGTAMGTRVGPGWDQLGDQAEGQGVVPGGSPLRGESPPGGTTPPTAPRVGAI